MMDRAVRAERGEAYRCRRRVGWPVMVAMVGLVSGAPATGESDYARAVRVDYSASLGALWSEFHRNPELSFKEVKTAARMAKELRAIKGMEVTEGVGGTGVVGVLRNGAGPTVLVRADMDGVPVEEKSGLENSSTVRQVDINGIEQPVMHGCGHDVHITSLVGTARQLALMTDRWRGTIVFVVQPAEELSLGAKAMLADGLYTRFPKPDYALALHVQARMASGTIRVSDTVMWSGGGNVDIVVHGVGGSGASPHATKDPVYIGSQIVIALQSIISREITPMTPGVITVGSFHAGTKHNVIPDSAKLELTFRANDEQTLAYLGAAIERVAHGVARANGVAEDRLPTVTLWGTKLPVINDAQLVPRLNAAIQQELGDIFVPFIQRGMGGEDFADLVAPEHGVRGYYFAIGGTPQAAFDAWEAGGPAVPTHHSALFRIDPESAVVTGTIAMIAAVLDLMKPGAN